MSKPDIARLYRRFTRTQTRGDALSPLDVDALVALGEGDHSEQTERLLADAGRSGLHADLLRLARALQPESARLGSELERAFEAASPQHRSRGRQVRIATMPRRSLRIASALAASLIAAVVVWSFQRDHASAPAPVVAAAHHAPDRIFASLGADARSPGRVDRIFHADFNADKIFTAEFNGG